MSIINWLRSLCEKDASDDVVAAVMRMKASMRDNTKLKEDE